MHMAVHHDKATGGVFALHDSRPLYLMTTVLGALIALDLLLPLFGYSNELWGFRYALIAAVLGGARTLYVSLEHAFDGEIGADIALALAAIAAILIDEPLVAAEVVFIAMFGESLEAITFGRTQRELRHLLELRPHLATVLRDGKQIRIHTEELQTGDRILVRPGERIPADGKVLAGQTTVDQSALTGESLPVDKWIGDEVFTGTLNYNGAIEFVAASVGEDTTFGQLLHLIEHAHERKAPVERTADRYARYFLPAVLVCAGLTWLVTRDVYRMVAILVVACPCGLVLATPAAVLAAVARLARHGVVLRGGIAIERLAQATALVFDKTGTLTEGRPTLGDVAPVSGITPDHVLGRAATAEQRSEHVLAGVIVRAVEERGWTVPAITDFQASPGAGVRATEGTTALLVGNRTLLEQHGIDVSEEIAAILARFDDTGQTALIVVEDRRPIGVVGVRDRVRPEAAETLQELKGLGFDDIALVTGDRWPAARTVAERFGIAHVLAEQRPTDKATFIETWKRQGKRVAMIGDGINDAPALAISDVGIALGGVGSNIAAEAGDIVMMRDPLTPLPFAVRMARQTMHVIRQDILLFAFGVNATAILLSAWGLLPPIGAAIYHQIGSLLVLLNSMRLLFFERWSDLLPIKRLDAWQQRAAQPLGWLDPMRSFDLAVRHRRNLVATALMLAVGYYLTSGITVIDADEVGVRQRFGKQHGEPLEAGLHLCLPPPFERVTRVRPNQIQTVEIGFRSLPMPTADGIGPLTIEWNSPHRDGLLQPEPEEGLMLTGDETMVEVNAVVHYRIGAVRTYLFGIDAPKATLRRAAESVLRSLAARTSENDLLTQGRRDFEQSALTRLRRRVGPREYNLGIDVVDLTLKDVHPPLDVVRAYHDVSSAMEEREQMTNAAEAYQRSTLLLADAEGTTRRNLAEGYKARETANAQARTHAFLVKQAAAVLAPDLSRFRWFWETIETSLARRPKVVLDPLASRRRQILIGEPDPIARQLPVLLNQLDQLRQSRDQRPIEEE